jgi:hypothetical protein
MRTLLAGSLASGVAAGLANVAVPAVAITFHAAALSGVFYSLASIGDSVAGLAYRPGAGVCRLTGGCHYSRVARLS